MKIAFRSTFLQYVTSVGSLVLQCVHHITVILQLVEYDYIFHKAG